MGLLCPPLSEGLDKQAAVTFQSGNSPQVSTLVNHNNHDILRLRCSNESSSRHKWVSMAVGDTANYVKKKGSVECCHCSGKDEDLLLDTTKIKENFDDNKVWEYPPPMVSSETRSRIMGYSPKPSIRPNKSNFKAGGPSSIILGFDSPTVPYCIGDCSIKDEVPRAITVGTPRPSESLSEVDMVVSSSVSLKKKASSPLAEMLLASKNDGIILHSGNDVGAVKILGAVSELVNNVQSSCINSQQSRMGYSERMRFPSMPVDIPKQLEISKSISGLAPEMFTITQTDGPLLHANLLSSSDLLEFKQIDRPCGPESYWFYSEPPPKSEIWSAACKIPSKPSASHRQGLSPSLLPLSPLGPKSGLLDAGSAGNLLSPCKGLRASSCSPSKLHSLSSELYIKQCSAASEVFAPTILRKVIEDCDDKMSFPGTPRKEHGLCGIDGNLGRIASFKSYAGVPTRRSLVGSFEESLLSGHFLSGHSSRSLDGFQALLSVSGGSWSPPMRKLPFSVTCVEGDNIQLYYASIDIAGDVSCNKAKSAKTRPIRFNEESRGIKRRYRIPMQGRVQLVLSNPESTPVHTFICSYDLTDMPFGTKTFMRHKVSLKSSPLIPFSKNVYGASYENVFIRRSPSTFNTLQPMVLLKDKTNKEWEYMSNQAEKDLPMKLPATQDHDYRGISSCEDHKGKCADLKTNCERKLPVYTDTDRDNIDVHIRLKKNGVNHETTAKPAKAQSSEKWYTNSMRTSEGLTDADIPAKSGTHTDHGGTVLRYALHLKFMCTPVKCGRSEAMPTSIGEDSLEISNVSSWATNVCNVKDSRHFYLYGDLRTVFPQRQSDADEGKLEAHFDFPADPKYFDFGS